MSKENNRNNLKKEDDELKDKEVEFVVGINNVAKKHWCTVKPPKGFT